MKISPRFLMGVVAAIVLLGGFAVIAFRGRPAIYTTPSGNLQTGTTANQPSGGTDPQQKVSAFTMAQVAAHNSVQSCWSVVSGGVYDLTTWISRHPGGPEVILGMCGVDGTAAFNDQHGGSRRPLYALGLLKIGTLQ